MQAKACPIPGPLPATRSVYAFPAWRVRVGNSPGKPELAAEARRGSRAQEHPPDASQHPGGVTGRERAHRKKKGSLCLPQLLFIGKVTLSCTIPPLPQHLVPPTSARESRQVASSPAPPAKPWKAVPALPGKRWESEPALETAWLRKHQLCKHLASHVLGFRGPRPRAGPPPSDQVVLEGG